MTLYPALSADRWRLILAAFLIFGKGLTSGRTSHDSAFIGGVHAAVDAVGSCTQRDVGHGRRGCGFWSVRLELCHDLFSLLPTFFQDFFGIALLLDDNYGLFLFLLFSITRIRVKRVVRGRWPCLRDLGPRACGYLDSLEAPCLILKRPAVAVGLSRTVRRQRSGRFWRRRLDPDISRAHSSLQKQDVLAFLLIRRQWSSIPVTRSVSTRIAVSSLTIPVPVAVPRFSSVISLTAIARLISHTSPSVLVPAPSSVIIPTPLTPLPMRVVVSIPCPFTIPVAVFPARLFVAKESFSPISRFGPFVRSGVLVRAFMT